LARGLLLAGTGSKVDKTPNPLAALLDALAVAWR
jgi:hypothetical protein